MADVPHNTQVYLAEPRMDKWNGLYTHSVAEVAQMADTPQQRIRIRATERGELNKAWATPIKKKQVSRAAAPLYQLRLAISKLFYASPPPLISG